MPVQRASCCGQSSSHAAESLLLRSNEELVEGKLCNDETEVAKRAGGRCDILDMLEASVVNGCNARQTIARRIASSERLIRHDRRARRPRYVLAHAHVQHSYLNICN